MQRVVSDGPFHVPEWKLRPKEGWPVGAVVFRDERSGFYRRLSAERRQEALRSLRYGLPLDGVVPFVFGGGDVRGEDVNWGTL